MRFVALLRAVNVGGTGKLPMETLRAMATEIGFGNPRTYIASGNLVFDSEEGEAKVRSLLEARLRTFAGKPVGVLVRSAPEMAAVHAHNPFPDAPGNRVAAIFLDAAPPADALEAMKGRADETAALGAREVYVHYPSGMGRSKLVIPAASKGTARNINTVAKLAEMAGDQ